MAEEYEGGEGGEGLEKPPSFFPYSGSDPERAPGNFGELVEVSVQGVFGAETKGRISHFVLLTDGVRKLPILIGASESNAIMYIIEQKRPDRPQTHDLIKNILDRVGCDIDRVVIDDFWNAVYYAKMYLQSGNAEVEIDSRPSDAIAMALRFEAPIYVADELLDVDSDLV
jgi:hypothetical protein